MPSERLAARITGSLAQGRLTRRVPVLTRCDTLD